jgi:hypothetical protein
MQNTSDNPSDMDQQNFTDELTEQLRAAHRCRPEVKELADRMASLDIKRYNTLIAELTEKGEAYALGILLNVAAVNRIELDPGVLATSLKGLDIILDISCPYKFQGEKAVEPLLEVALAEDISTKRQALAILLAAELTVKFDLPVQPVKKIAQRLSREIIGFESRMVVDSCLALLEIDKMDLADRKKDFLLIEQDVLKTLPKERPPAVVGDGGTIRRPVVKVGRNEPCHCGSGKKYKKCCLATDEKLLRDPSAYEGVTASQILSQPSLVEDTAPIEKLRAYELKKLQPSRMNDNQLLIGYRRCYLFGLRELALEMLLELRQRPDQENPALNCMLDLFFEALYNKDKDLVEALNPHIPPEKLELHEVHQLHLRTLRNPSEFEELETLCRKAVVGAEPPFDHFLLELSYAFDKVYPAMSIVFGRAAIVSEPNRWMDNDTLLDVIQSNRILLDLEPLGDPIEDYLDWTFEKDFPQSLDHGKDQKIDGLKSKLEEAREKGGKAIRDLRKKEIELSALEKRIAEKERVDRELGEKTKVIQAIPARPSKRAALHDDESAIENRTQISKLKEKINFLQGEIRSHQENRQEYRQKIREAERTIAKLSDRQDSLDTVSEEGGEAPAEIQAGFQRIAIPEFSKTFRKNCESLPQDIVARALQATTAFAAREDTVLRQAKKLELIPDIFRIRIGRNYRLLVRQTTQQSLEVLDLIPRGQFENWIRRYMA